VAVQTHTAQYLGAQRCNLLPCNCCLCWRYQSKTNQKQSLWSNRARCFSVRYIFSLRPWKYHQTCYHRALWAVLHQENLQESILKTTNIIIHGIILWSCTGQPCYSVTEELQHSKRIPLNLKHLFIIKEHISDQIPIFKRMIT